MDIYKREANSRGQVSERQPSRNAAFLQQGSKEQKRLKRRSGRAVAHAGLEEKKEKKQKKPAELAQVMDGAAQSPSRAKRRGISRLIPGAQIELRLPCSMFPCLHVPMFMPPSLRRRLHWPRRCQLGGQAVWGRWRLQAPGLGSGAKPVWAGAE